MTKELRVLTMDEVHRILAAADLATAVGIAIALIVSGRCKVTEAARLRGRDIHQDNLGRILLRVPGKPWSTRLPNALGAALERFSASGDPEELLLGLNARQAQGALQATARRVGVERVTVAMFRRSLAAAAVQAGVPVPGISTWLLRRPPSPFGLKAPMEEQWNAEMRTFVDRWLGCAE